MAEYLAPGVYVEEFDSGGKPMEGAGTSTAGFIGLACRGPVIGIPRLVTNVSDFRRTYGGYLSENECGTYRYLAYAVEQFFANGGSRCFISRVAPEDAACAEGDIPGKEKALIHIRARNPGTWGDDIRVVISPSSKAKTQILEQAPGEAGKVWKVKNGSGFKAGDVVVFSDGEQERYNAVVKSQDHVLTFEQPFEDDVTDQSLLPVKTLSTCEFTMEVRYEDTVELYENLSFNISGADYICKKTEKSELITVSCEEAAEPLLPPFAQICGDEHAVIYQVVLRGGSNGSMEQLSAADFIGTDNGAGRRTGIQSFIDNDVVSIIAVPGVTDPNVQVSLVAHCENLASRFAVLDIPRDAWKTDEILAHRELFDSSYAALYHPWLQVYDPLDKKNMMVPPSGAVMGIYARSDNSRGVHKAPANEVVRACTGLDCQFNKGEQDILNPRGVNLIRAFPGQGIRVWGARTASSDPGWRYINVRRLFIFIEETIRANTSWAVFEPNDEVLWTRVQRTISVFLEGLWQNGSLAGSSTGEAFFVNIGQNTMSQDDIDNGRLICVIGVAPVKPAEFVIFRITQKTSDAE